MSVFYQSIFVCRENTDTVFLLWFSLRTDIIFSIVLEKTYILDQTKLWECRLTTNYDILRQQQARFQISIAIIDVEPQINKTVLFVQNIWRIACLGTKIFPEDLTMFPDASNDKAPE